MALGGSRSYGGIHSSKEKMMAKIKALDQESNPISAVNVLVYDSLGKKVGGITTNSQGEGEIPNAYLSNPNNEIRASRVEYNPTKVKVSNFKGVVYLGKKETTLGEVVIVRKKSPKITIKSPFETETPTSTPVTKKKMTIPLVLGGGILVGLLSLLLIKAKN